jgi:thymidylate synthase
MLRRSLQTLKERRETDKCCHVHDENQYLALIEDILLYGNLENGRNGIAKTVCGSAMHFSLANNVIPILTTKVVAYKTCFKELMWFIRGQTDNSLLKAQQVGIWNGNASRSFLDSQGLFHRAENDLGPIYGHQWRHFNAPYDTCFSDYTGQGFDQLGDIINQLKNPATRTSRRLVMSAWNPCQMKDMALPPCHILAQFHVTHGDQLSCSLFQRSADVGLGVPFNIASYAFLTHLLAHFCGLKASEFYYHLGNCHIYDDHLEALAKQVERKPYPFPTICFLNLRENIEDFTIEDFEIKDYVAHEKIVMAMRE